MKELSKPSTELEHIVPHHFQVANEASLSAHSDSKMVMTYMIAILNDMSRYGESSKA